MYGKIKWFGIPLYYFLPFNQGNNKLRSPPPRPIPLFLENERQTREENGIHLEVNRYILFVSRVDLWLLKSMKPIFFVLA